VLRRELARIVGGTFHALYANGTCGDIFWVDTDFPPWPHFHPFYNIERVGRILASETYRQWQNIRDWAEDAPVRAAWQEVTFRRREATAEQMREAERLLQGPAQPENREWVYANELMRLAQEPPEWPVPIQALRIGDLGIVGLPGEVFVEIGLAIKRLSPFPYTMVIELANDWAGYIPTDTALLEGSYETRLATVSKAAPGTADLWIRTATDLLQALWTS
jgi:neutral ceramidase